MNENRQRSEPRVANLTPPVSAEAPKPNAEVTAELARFRRSAVPFNLLYLPGKPEPVELPALLTPDIVLEALARQESLRPAMQRLEVSSPMDSFQQVPHRVVLH